MTTRSRNILIVIVLLLLIGAGGALIYFFRGAPTLVLTATDLGGGQTVPLSKDMMNPSGMEWLNCTRNDPGAGYNQPFGHSFEIEYTCTNTDTSNAHGMDLKEYTLVGPVFERPDNQVCLDSDDHMSVSEWPPYYGEAEITPVIADKIFTGQANWNCEYLQANKQPPPNDEESLQEPAVPNKPPTRIDFEPGQQKTFKTNRSFSECDYYQYDDMVFDTADPTGNTYQYLVGRVQRSFGAPAACGFAVPQAAKGNLTARMYFDADGNKEYSTPSAVPPGTDKPYAQQTVHVYNEAGVDITTQDKCSQGTQTGGAGRFDCWQIPIGKYRVTVSNPDPNTLEGPVKDVGQNPYGQEKHNENGVEDLTLTVIEGNDPPSDPAAPITIYDFGYIKKGVSAVGSLLVRVYEEQNTDDEYTNAAEGAVFGQRTPAQLIAIRDDQGAQINVSNPDCPASIDQAGTLTCKGLEPGDYSVEVDPAITTHDGPEPEPHNPQGVSPYTVNVPLSPQAIADFQYKKRIIVPGEIVCQLNADPTSGIQPLDVDFTTTVTPANTPIQSYDWVFGDGQTAQTSTATNTHTYQNQGSYTPAVTVTTVEGKTASCNTTVQVTRVQPTAITCTLTANPDQGLSPLDVTLTTAVTPANTQVTSYVYDFGDGSAPQTSTSNSVQHQYTGFETFTASVTVTDSNGQIAHCQDDIKVQQQPTGDTCTIEVVDYLDLNRNLQQDPGIIGYIDPGMNGANVSIQLQGGTAQNKTTAQVGVNRYGEAAFTDIPCGTYMVAIDETSQVTVGGTTQQYVLNQLQRLTPAQASTQVTVGAAQTGVRVGFGYAPRIIVAGEPFECDIDKSVSDTTPADEGTPDDPKVTVSSQGETLTFDINWICTGIPTDPEAAKNISFTLIDTPDPALTVITNSITGGGVYNQSQGTITWTIQGAANVDQGSVQFQATVPTNLAPGTYIYPNFVVATRGNEILDQDQTLSIVTVADNGEQVPDIEVVKYAQDLNGGQVLPGDVLQYYVVVWNNGNTPLVATVTENIQPNVSNFDVITIPSGAVDSSTGPGTGSNGTGYLNVTNINLANRGDTATITYQVTVNSGVPGGTQLVNFVTAAAEGVTDTDDETVVVGEILPNPPPPPAPGPGPVYVPTGQPGVPAGQPSVPPIFGPRIALGPPAGAPQPAPETGIASVMWILLASLLVGFGTAGYFVMRQHVRSLDS
ncbi:MAG: PKD domain-containing protein [Parcubacteria group bacterium]